MSLLYYIKNRDFIRGGYTFMEMTRMPLYPHFLIRRGETGKWIPIGECVELSRFLTDSSSHITPASHPSLPVNLPDPPTSPIAVEPLETKQNAPKKRQIWTLLKKTFTKFH